MINRRDAKDAEIFSHAESAVNIYEPAYGLPPAISAMNTDWVRGYGDPPPQTLIIIGWNQAQVYHYFETCTLAGTIPNPYGVENEDTVERLLIFVCKGLRLPWPAFWKAIKSYGDWQHSQRLNRRWINRANQINSALLLLSHSCFLAGLADAIIARRNATKPVSKELKWQLQIRCGRSPPSSEKCC